MQAHIRLEEYPQAAEVVQDTLENYPGNATVAQQVPNIELIFIKLLKKPEQALEIYRDLRKKSENPKINQFLERKISQLESLKKF